MLFLSNRHLLAVKFEWAVVRTGPLVSRTGPRVQTHVDTAHVFHSLFYYDFITS